MSSTDTIVALSSGRLPAGVAVVRMSGPATRFVLETMVGEIPQPRHARLCVVRAADGQAIDRGLVLFFPGPASFTGEDCAELHLHGGRAVVSKVLESLADSSGVRLAEAGEFTRRAFLNGKLDLLQAEALADLVSAETEAQRRLAMRNSEGAQTALYQEWRHTLLRSRALIEAELDFSDEQDVPGSVSDTIWPALSALASDMARHIDGYKRAEMVRDGFEVVIVGRPNAGKSSLLNVLARRDVAIVSDEPGTTRDLVEVVLDIGGMRSGSSIRPVCARAAAWWRRWGSNVRCPVPSRPIWSSGSTTCRPRTGVWRRYRWPVARLRWATSSTLPPKRIGRRSPSACPARPARACPSC